MAAPPKKRLALFTIGHSTRPIEAFIELLKSNGVRRLIDIRAIPRSRRNPQFSTEALAASLRVAGIDYVHLRALGGLRRPRKDSVNLGWNNVSFRGYADYMQTPEFEAAIGRAMELGFEEPTALMCAEALPWRCHRSLVADALLARGVEVQEIISSAAPKAHQLTPWARVAGTQVTYPQPATAQLSLPAEPAT